MQFDDEENAVDSEVSEPINTEAEEMSNEEEIIFDEIENGEEDEWLEFSSVGRRIAAFIVDAILLIIVSSTVVVLAGLEDFALYFFFAFASFYSLVFWAWKDRTPGKMIVGIKIVKEDCSSIGLSKALLRVVGYCGYLIVCYFLGFLSFILLVAIFIMIARSANKQGLHDRIAGTYVVKTR